jgi:hypothetical protein
MGYRKKLILIFGLLLALMISLLGLTSYAQGTRQTQASWITASPPKTCSKVCSQRDLQAVSSGKDRYGYTFYVCRGRANNNELRPGFNISTSPDSDNLCLFEFYGGRQTVDDYDCLCMDGAPRSER